MSKRLQVLLSERELRAAKTESERQQQSLAEWVREALRLRLESSSPVSADERLGRILKYARYRGPTGDIEKLLAQIEHGRE